MSNPNLEESAKAATDIFQAADPVVVRSMFQLIHLLLEAGNPVSAEKVASRLQISRVEATTILKELRVRGAAAPMHNRRASERQQLQKRELSVKA